MVALLTFRHFIFQTVKGHMRQLKQIVVASPLMRSFYVRILPTDETSSKISAISKDVKRTKVEGQLIYLLKILWEDDRNLFLLGLSCVVEESELLLLSEPTAGDFTSKNIASTIGNIAIVSQCLYHLRYINRGPEISRRRP
jgi:hypothetical protein